MSQDNQGNNSQNDKGLNSSLGSTANQQKGTITVQGVEFTPEEVEEANKPQPNVILAETPGINTGNYRDNERVGSRANEASDSNDSNSGGIPAGGSKGASQS